MSKPCYENEIICPHCQKKKAILDKFVYDDDREQYKNIYNCDNADCGMTFEIYMDEEEERNTDTKYEYEKEEAKMPEKKHNLTEEQIKEIVEEIITTGKSIESTAKEKGISKSTLGYHVKKARENNPSPAQKENHPNEKKAKPKVPEPVEYKAAGPNKKNASGVLFVFGYLSLNEGYTLQMSKNEQEEYTLIIFKQE